MAVVAAVAAVVGAAAWPAVREPVVVLPLQL
jgi:hypothetical protein